MELSHYYVNFLVWLLGLIHITIGGLVILEGIKTNQQIMMYAGGLIVFDGMLIIIASRRM